MTSRNFKQLTILTVFLFALGGCGQYYNGGYGLKSKDREAVLAYEQAKEERAAQVKQAELEARRIESAVGKHDDWWWN